VRPADDLFSHPSVDQPTDLTRKQRISRANLFREPGSPGHVPVGQVDVADTVG
jgi:hypothetical protein